ncbi:hypothetical protein ACHAWO_007046 [Cyclotella atomus]|uniref:Uncharacterized protein n=1 Tax=Cyclotella atomus TaxID=382360 RepID=A0ABD3Q932_9STRA
MMNLSSPSEEARRQLFDKGQSVCHHKPPQVTTYQTFNTFEAPAISASSPVRCSLGEKDRPAGWQNLLEKRLQKGPLSPTAGFNNKKKSTSTPRAKVVNVSVKDNATVEQKANEAYRKKKNVKDELKRQSALAAAAAAAASSPEYIANLTLQMKATEKKVAAKKENMKRSTSVESLEKVVKPSIPTQHPAMPEPRPSQFQSAPIQQEPQVITQKSKEKVFFPDQQQAADLYYEPSPMCRLRNQAPSRCVTTLLKRYQDLSPKVTKDVMIQDAKEDEQKLESIEVYHVANNENDGDMQNTTNKPKKVKVKKNKIFQPPADSIVGSILTKSNNAKLMVEACNNEDGSVSSKTNLLQFRNRDFGNTKRSLLTMVDPRIEIEKSMREQPCLTNTDQSAESSSSSCCSSVELKKTNDRRRADVIQNHKSNVGSTLKSIGIDITSRKVAKKSSPSITATAPKPKKKKGSLRTIISSQRNIDLHRRDVYEAVRARRCFLLQTRRGIAVPTVRKVSYQRYSFLERQRLGILQTGLIKHDDVDNSSSNTVVSIYSTSSSYCDEMLAQAKELRKARQSLAKQLGTPLESISSESDSTVMTIHSLSAVVKRRKARLTSNMDEIERTGSGETEATTASAKRSKAMEKIRRNKVKALQRENEC